MIYCYHASIKGALPMKTRILNIIGYFSGVTIAKAYLSGFANIDWIEVCFVTLLIFLILHFLYHRKPQRVGLQSK